VLFQLGFWVPLLICTYLALVPEPPDNPVFRLSDIILHAAAFTYLSLALVLAQFGGSLDRGRLYLRTFLFMLGYGVFLELAQSLVPERSPEIKDLLVDLGGIGAGLALAGLLAPTIHRLVQALAMAAVLQLSARR